MKNLKHGVMKTAIDWLWEQYNDNCDCGGDVEYTLAEKLFKQAKLLEKEQLSTMHLVTWMNKDLDFDNYYFETYEDQRSDTNH